MEGEREREEGRVRVTRRLEEQSLFNCFHSLAVC
jgi:hypothetical protein